ncbi:hypothetical protein TpMuguga_01g00481 [Theileria parva strain Muguga]|uniref:Uncharacterized protein n=1 Tax=Theileria parva TaxID=5875 RepID=Q4N8J0_THEPA|nr:hypothetical protein TpMuguga_01g00481 [Theileria parva strain Muguga]
MKKFPSKHVVDHYYHNTKYAITIKLMC